MDAHQQFVLAADMLTNARGVDGLKGLPTDEMTNTFRGGLLTACVVDSMKMTEMGAALYVTERERWVT